MRHPARAAGFHLPCPNPSAAGPPAGFRRAGGRPKIMASSTDRSTAMNQTALIVNDAQQTFKNTAYWSESDLPDYLAQQQRLIDGCAARGVPVVQIFHASEQGPFAVAADRRAIDGLNIHPTVTLTK